MTYYKDMLTFGSINHIEFIRTLCHPLLQQYDIHHFSAGITSLEEGWPMLGICNQPDVFTRYFEKKYFNLECVAFNLCRKYLQVGNTYIMLHSPHYDNVYKSRLLSAKVNQMLKELRISQCVSILQVKENSVTQFSFGTHCEHKGILPEILLAIKQLKQFGNQFLKDTKPIFDKIKPYQILTQEFSSPNLVSKLLHRMGLTTDPQLLRDCGSHIKMDANRLFKDNCDIKRNTHTSFETLTERELECLKAYAGGSTAKGIARKLDISIRTAENHLYNGRKKMGAKNNPHFYQLLNELFE